MKIGALTCFGLWNPVKELKANPSQGLVRSVLLDVESGEGIER